MFLQRGVTNALSMPNPQGRQNGLSDLGVGKLQFSQDGRTNLLGISRIIPRLATAQGFAQLALDPGFNALAEGLFVPGPHLSRQWL